jgi:hypothetical protein
MRQAIHIFAKDVRALWPQILLVLALTSAAAAAERDLVTWALVLTRCYLIVGAVHQEKLVGDRQWWLTRPYSWKSLLGAKALLMAVFVNLPLFVSDVVCVVAARLPLGPAWPNIWMRQAILALVWQYGLPAMALAAVTRGLVSFALAGVGALAAVFTIPAAFDALMRWGLLAWIPLSLGMIALTLGPVAVLVWQYRWRWALPARAVLCGMLLVCIAVVSLPPAAWAFGIQARVGHNFERAENIRLRLTGYDLDSEGHLEVGIGFDGVPEDMRVELNLFRLELAAGETKWNSGWRTPYGPAWEDTGRGAKVSTAIPPALLQKLPSRNVDLRLSVALTVLGPERTQVVDMRRGDVAVDGVGICGLREQAPGAQAMQCRSAAPLKARTWAPIPGASFPMTLEWPIRFSLDASPVWHMTARLPSYLDGRVGFQTRKPVAHLRRDLLVDKVRLTSAQ